MTRRIDQASARQRQPWREAGVSRATWFRQRAHAGETGKAAEPRATIMAETRKRAETGKGAETIIPLVAETRKAPPAETVKGEAVIETVMPVAGETIKALRLIESKRGPGRCAQCSDLRDGTEIEHVIHNASVLLHPECVPYYVKSHDEHHAKLWP